MSPAQRFLLLCCTLFCAPACGVTEIVDRDQQGQAILIRTPQPDATKLRDLQSLHGVKTVLNLRGERPGESWYEEEKKGVEAIEARWVHLELNSKEAPTKEEIGTFFDLLENRENWPVLVHCQGGIHRTGYMVALYRMQYQNWEAERAIEEMEDRYFNWGITNRRAIKRFLRKYQTDPDRHIARDP